MSEFLKNIDKIRLEAIGERNDNDWKCCKLLEKQERLNALEFNESEKNYILNKKVKKARKKYKKSQLKLDDIESIFLKAVFFELSFCEKGIFFPACESLKERFSMELFNTAFNPFDERLLKEQIDILDEKIGKARLRDKSQIKINKGDI